VPESPPEPQALVALSPRQASIAAEAVVCAAADALDLPPSRVRAALVAAFRRAGEAGISIEAAERAIAAADRERSGSVA
jgi:hypothetical protein